MLAVRSAARLHPGRCTAHRVWVKAASGPALASVNPLNPQMGHCVHVLYPSPPSGPQRSRPHEKVCVQRDLVSGKSPSRWGQGPAALAVTACHLHGEALRPARAQNRSATEDLIAGNRDRHHKGGSDHKILGLLLWTPGAPATAPHGLSHCWTGEAEPATRRGG